MLACKSSPGLQDVRRREAASTVNSRLRVQRDKSIASAN